MNLSNKNELLVTKSNMILTLEKKCGEKKSLVMELNNLLYECKTFSSCNKIRIEFRYDYRIDKIISIINSLKKNCHYQSIILRINYYSNNIKSILNQIILLDCFSKIVFGKNFSSNKFSFIKMIGIEQVEYIGKNFSNTKLLPKNLKSIIINNKKMNKNIFLDLPEYLNELVIKKKHTHIGVSLFSYNVKNIMIMYCNDKINLTNPDLECLMFDGNLKIESNLTDNLPNKLKMLFLSSQYNKPIDLLPNSLEFLAIGNPLTQLNNLPSSINRFVVNFTIKDFEFLSCLPDSIEYLIFTGFIDINGQTDKIKKMPNKLKEITIRNKFINNYVFALQFFETYKKENNVDFIYS